MEKNYRIVGKSVPRVDGVEKVTGAARYAGDLIFPGMLHGKILRSPHPHARIVSINAEKALRLPGVRAVITGKDGPGTLFGFLPQTRDRLALPIDKVRYIGEEVAAVVCWKKGEDAIKAEAKLRYRLMNPLPNIRSFEVPQYITTLNASELPMTSTGKVQRSVLRKTIAPEKFRHVNSIVSSEKYEFIRLAAYEKPRMKEALELFNRCWQPLVIDAEKLQAHVSNGFIIICIPKGGGPIQSMISLLRTDMGEKELSKSTYDELTGNLSMATSKLYGRNIVCVSICSASYVPQTPGNAKAPPASEMEKYLASGGDPVYAFHVKKKGDIEGAKLLSLLPDARPDDKLSLGYCMLLEYPSIPAVPCIPKSGSAASQLIEAVMEFARQQDVKRVFAFSRPAGSSEYFGAKKN